MSNTMPEGKSLDEVEEYYEGEFQPLIPLKQGINISDLMNDGGAEIELDEDGFKKIGEKSDESSQHGEQHFSAAAFDGGEEEEDDEGLSPFEALEKKMTPLVSDRGVLKQVLQPGTGDVVPKGNEAFCQYSMFLEYADEPFDCTRMRGERQRVRLMKEGDTECDVIEGLDIALASMRKGEMSRFLIKPEYAYGHLGVPPRIPENATLMAEVELLYFMATGSAEAYLSLPISERKDAPFDMCLQAVESLRNTGNELFKQKRYDIASQKYQKAIRLLQDARLANETDERRMEKALLKNLTNVAVCHSKLKEWKRVITFANQALQMEKTNAKILYLKGKALRNLGDLERSREALLKARRENPSDSMIAKELEELDKAMRRQQTQERVMCENMFGGNKNSTKSAKDKDISIQTSSAQKASEIDPKKKKVPTATLR